MTKKIGPLVIDLEGKAVSSEERELLNHPLIGGVILFTRNYESREQLTDLCATIRSSCPHPILIMVDQEGGRVQRFIPEFTRLPFMAVFGEMYKHNAEKASLLARHCGWLMATELLTTGVDLSLAPVLDLNKGINSVIGQRAFHTKPHEVIQLAGAFIQGMKNAGMAATGKHFPGHGSVALDSHLAHPVDERDLAEIEREDMLPFIEMIKKGIPAIMAAHIVYPKLDPLPVGFSPYWLKKILRDKLQFKGVIFSDDLSMEGANISTHYSDRVIAAREAGCDFTLICNQRKGAIQALDHVPLVANLMDSEKYLPLQGNFMQAKQAYKKSPHWQEAYAFIKLMDNDNSLGMNYGNGQ